MKKIKEEDLILYLYNEAAPAMRIAIEQALEENIELSDKLAVLRRSMKQLDLLTLKSPSRQSLKTIMKHARSVSGKK